ncbi:MAG: YbbR-like domain-containing protein [Candidatus Eiseniibacteriota bacterium]|nr:MAG: YbbR-like domain-containing protein [Candidatus Eisenbacteria bacterium]
MSLAGSIFRENLGIKLAALALSILVLFHVRTERQGEVAFQVPVELTGIPDSLAWGGAAPGSVSVTLRGKLKNLIKLRLGSLRIPVDLTQAVPGRFQRTLSAGDVPFPEESDVSVSHFGGPSRIDILIERKISRAVPVAPVLVGELPQFFGLTEAPTVYPATVVVTGAASAVSKVDSVYTEPIDLSGKRQSFSTRTRLDAAGGSFSCDVEVVEVFVALAGEGSESSRR